MHKNKNPIKDQWPEGRQKGKAKEKQKHEQPAKTKKWERASPFCGRKLFHPRFL